MTAWGGNWAEAWGDNWLEAWTDSFVESWDGNWDTFYVNWSVVHAKFRALGLNSYQIDSMANERLTNLGYTTGALPDKLKAYKNDTGKGKILDVYNRLSS